MTSPWRPKIDSDTVRPPIGRRAAGQDNEEPAGWAALGTKPSLQSVHFNHLIYWLRRSQAHRGSHCRKVEAMLTSLTVLAYYETSFAPPLRCANLEKTNLC